MANNVENGQVRAWSDAEQDWVPEYVGNLPAGPGGDDGSADPTALVGLAAVPGSAPTWMRSDAAPALSQSIAPTWTGVHTFGSNKLVAPNIGPSITQRHTVPAVASDTLALVAASQALTNKTYNGLTVPATTGTFSLANGKTLTVQHTLTLAAASDGLTLTVPATGTAAIGAGTLSAASANNVATATHTHAITSSSNPGAAASLLASNASGYLQLERLGIGLAPTHRLTVGGDVFINNPTANLYFVDTSTGFTSSSSTVMTPLNNNHLRTTNYFSGLTGWNVAATGDAEFNNVTVRGAIRAAILLYNAVLTTSGTRLTTKSAAKLRNTITISPSAVYNSSGFTVDVDDLEGIAHAASQVFAVDDSIRIKDGLSGDTWFKVLSASDQDTFWRYVFVIVAGSVGVTYNPGIGVINYGQAGDGFIIETADMANAPYIQMATHNGLASGAGGGVGALPQLRIGNLNGSYGYATNVYGFGAGQYGASSKTWITVEQTNGIRIGNNTTTLAQWSIGGNITVGRVAAGESNVFISSGALDLRVNTTPRIHLASDGSGYVANSSIAWDTSGNLTVTGNAAIGGWTINASNMSSGGIVLAAHATAASNKIYVGTGTFNNANTAFYVDGSGRMSLKDKLSWDGTTLTINGGGTFSGALSAATGTFSGSLSAATGTFSGTLTASTIVTSVFTTGHSNPGTAATFGGTTTAGVLPLYALNGAPGLGFNAYLDGLSIPHYGLGGPAARLYLTATGGDLLYYNAPSGATNAVVSSETIRFSILNGGNVGIGTALPLEKFHIVTSSRTGAMFSLAGSGTHGRIHATTADRVALTLNASFDGTNWNLPDDTTKYGAILHMAESTTNGQIFMGGLTAGSNPRSIVWVMTVDVSQTAVGIGTTAPVISGTGKLHMAADTFRLDTARTPASATAAGNAGEICWANGFIYVCVATNTWKRAALSTW
jgi:hypothetical protein